MMIRWTDEQGFPTQGPDETEWRRCLQQFGDTLTVDLLRQDKRWRVETATVPNRIGDPALGPLNRDDVTADVRRRLIECGLPVLP
jgi:hypothetical protein